VAARPPTSVAADSRTNDRALRALYGLRLLLNPDVRRTKYATVA
jgi:hypothetical protein